MENQVIFRTIEEIRQQCRFAQFAWQSLRSSLHAMDSEKTFFYVQAFLSHAHNVSRMLWPARPESMARGEKLRGELKFTDDSPLRLGGFRSQLEDVDERFEDWLADPDHRNYVDMNLMPLGTIADFKPDKFHRSLDPEHFHCHLRGAECDLRKISDELKRAEAAVQRWLKTHSPW